MQIVSDKPLIEILPVSEQHDRFDFTYYEPRFVEAEEQLLSSFDQFIPLGDIIEEGRYGVLPPPSIYGDHGIFFVRSSNLTCKGIDYDKAILIPKEWLLKAERARIKCGDILISVKGARAFFDICAVIEEPPEAIVNGSIFRFQCKEEYLPEFVMLWLLSNPVQLIVFRNRVNLGISYISLDIINSIPFPKIDKTLQQRFIECYGMIRIRAEQVFKQSLKLCEAKNRTISRLDDAFQKRLNFPSLPKEKDQKVFICPKVELMDRLDVKGNQKRSRLLTKIFAETKNFVKFSDIIVTIWNGQTHREYCPSQEQGATRFLCVADIKEGKIINNNQKFISNPMSKAKLSPGILLFTRKGTVGQVVIPEAHELDFIPSYEIICIDLNKISDKQREVIKLFFLSNYGKLAVHYMTSGGQMPAISHERLFELYVPLVSEDDAEYIINVAKEIEFAVQAVETQIEIINNLANKMIATAKSNIFALLDDAHFENILAMADNALVSEVPE